MIPRRRTKWVRVMVSSLFMLAIRMSCFTTESQQEVLFFFPFSFKICMTAMAFHKKSGPTLIFFIFYWKQNTVELSFQSTSTPNNNNQNKKLNKTKPTNPKIKNISCIKKKNKLMRVPLHVIISNTYLYIHKHLKNRKQ